jgi:predicted O-linked N-acetylglucosamine transferase (SPINDLY family)
MAGIVDTAIQHHREGRFAEALMLYELLIDDNADPQLVHLAGMACLGLNQPENAEPYLARAAAAAPQRSDFLMPLGICLFALGKVDTFLDLLSRAGDADLARLGVLKTAGSAEAVRVREGLARLVQESPGNGRLAGVMGYAHLLNGDPGAALPFYRTAARLLPGDHDIRRLAGLTAAALDDGDEAVSWLAADQGTPCEDEMRRHIEFMLAVLPDACKLPMAMNVFRATGNLRLRHFCVFHAIGLKAVAETDSMLRDLAEQAGVDLTPPPGKAKTAQDIQEHQVFTYFTHAARLDEGDYIIFLLLALALQDEQDIPRVVAAAKRAVTLKPDDVESVLVLARYTSTFNLKLAVDILAEALPRVGYAPEVLNLLGNLRMRTGDMPGAAEAYDMARARLGPADGEKLEWQLLTANYRHDLDPVVVADMHRRWGEALERRLAPRRRRSRQPRTGRPLRVGYVSGDFKTTSPAYFSLPLLQHHDPARVSAYLYATHEKDDEGTPKFRELAGGNWRDVHETGDDALAELIEADGIDILVDLCGHTMGARLPVFAMKPAPVQVTWLGYPNTTGLSAIDYRFTDALADPPGLTEALHTERLWRLPHFLCYQPMEHTPPVAPAACLALGHATFGCFNNSNKVTPEVARAWAEILRRAPTARLVMKTAELGDKVTADAFIRRFTEQGIDSHRIECLPAVKRKFDHLKVYGRIDMALDPFPYTGTTTTFEALWMGVPTLTLEGRSHAARVGASILIPAGLPQLVARSPEDYIARAVALANDLPALAALRTGLRERLAASPLMDGPAFARSVEDAYESMLKAVEP